MAAIVFHLMSLRSGRLADNIVLRYDFDPRCDVERGDVWQRTTTGGDMSYHRVNGLRLLEGVHGEELHAFLVPHREPAVL